MKEKSLSKLSLLILSLVFLGSGITITIYNNHYYSAFHLLTSYIMIGIGEITLLLNIIRRQKENKIRDLILSIASLNVGIFFLNNKENFLSLFPIIFGFYMLINGLSKIMTYLVFKNRENTSYYQVLFSSLIDFIFSYIMISEPSNHVELLTLILGLYLSLFGITYFYDFLKECFPNKLGNKRRIRITLPIIVAMIIPYEVLLSINKALSNWKTELKVDNKNTSGKVDLEILIHVRNDKVGLFGHIDLCYKGIVYSYGSYDFASRKLFQSVGNGTLYEIKGKEKYIKYCNKYSNKTIFVFGLTLTDEQKKKVESKIRTLKNNTYRWTKDKIQESGKNDYAMELVELTDAKFYKFYKSSYKTYFIFFTNCVKLVDDIIGVTGSDLLKINGALTPGTYYDYLEREFKRKNSNVITKEIYTPKKEI